MSLFELQLQGEYDEGQLLPLECDEYRFADDQRSLLETLEDRGIEVKNYASAFNPYPFLIPNSRLDSLRALQESIQRAVVAIVQGYRKDSRIRAVIPLEKEEADVVERLSLRPYRPGSFRPDFLHAADGRAMVTEINARFPLNGYLSSHILSGVMAERYPGLVPLTGMERLAEVLRSRVGIFADIGLLKSSEAGWDIHIFKKWMGSRARMAELGELTPERVRGWGSVILELNQHELLHELPDGVLDALLEHPGLLNDPRTIFIAHDKRLLSLLSTSPVIEDHLEPADVRRLREQVIPTWVKGLSPERVDEARDHGNWICKPPREGKGQGFLLTTHMDHREWDEALRRMPDDHILQPYVEQRTFPITCLLGHGILTRDMRVVGLLPSLDDALFGPGMYRAAPDDIVNVARGGTILAPAWVG